MSVTLRRQRDGTLRPYWYGEHRDRNGKRTVLNLGEWQGTPPPSLLGTGTETTGSAEFEASREAAELALKAHAEDAGRKGRADHLIERLIEQKTGKAVDHVRIPELAQRWETMPRGAKLTKAHASGVGSACERFRAFMATRNRKAAFLYEVTTADAGAFAELLRSEYAPKTARDYTVLLRSAFRRFLPAGVANPFAGIVASNKGAKGESGVVHRRPFTPEELQRIIDAAKGDDFMGDLITAAACTGARRGDVCSLKWADVDLAAGMVTTKASKTGEAIEVPIFGPLRTVLETRKGNKSAFVFPEAARMLEKNPDGLTWRFKKVLARALASKGTALSAETFSAADVQAEAVKAIEAHTQEGDRRERLLDTFRRYAAGQSVRMIEKETGRSRSWVSTDLHTVEDWTGKQFTRRGQGRHTKGQKARGVKADIARVTRTDREHGQRAASVMDWHALRTTFVTLALSAGVPMELVRRVTGHQTVEIVLKNYFRPGRAEFKAALTGALPDVLTGGKVKARKATPADELAALVGKVQGGTATEKDKTRLRLLAAKV